MSLSSNWLGHYSFKVEIVGSIPTSDTKTKAMKLQYKARKGNRIKYKFMGFTGYDNYWYCKATKKWTQTPDWHKGGISNHCPCKSVRAFRRKLKEAPKGVEFTLTSRWVGYDVIGYGTGNYN
jgi:hypothetical protein